MNACPAATILSISCLVGDGGEAGGDVGDVGGAGSGDLGGDDWGISDCDEAGAGASAKVGSDAISSSEIIDHSSSSGGSLEKAEDPDLENGSADLIDVSTEDIQPD